MPPVVVWAVAHAYTIRRCSLGVVQVVAICLRARQQRATGHMRTLRCAHACFPIPCRSLHRAAAGGLRDPARGRATSPIRPRRRGARGCTAPTSWARTPPRGLAPCSSARRPLGCLRPARSRAPSSEPTPPEPPTRPAARNLGPPSPPQPTAPLRGGATRPRGAKKQTVACRDGPNHLGGLVVGAVPSPRDSADSHPVPCPVMAPRRHFRAAGI